MGKKTNVVLPNGKEMKGFVFEELEKAGVTPYTVAESVMERIAKGELPFLKEEYTLDEVAKIAKKQLAEKREFQIIALIALHCDAYSNGEKQLEPFYQLLNADWGLFGGDEYIMLSIMGIWGPTAKRLFGWFDKDKSGNVKKMDSNPDLNMVYLDDFHAGWEAVCVAIMEKQEIYSDPEITAAMLDSYTRIRNYLMSHTDAPEFEMDAATKRDVEMVLGSENNYYHYASVSALLDQKRYTPNITAKDVKISKEVVLFKLDFLIPLLDILDLKDKWSRDGRTIKYSELNGFDRRRVEHALTNVTMAACERYGFIGQTNIHTEIQKMLNSGHIDFPSLMAMCLSCAIRARVAFEQGEIQLS
ncbi:hypothetical protein [Risungbinella massiliensis]|uniref:hypothetical protein n=1 Tax=Risungbinella massiliensis TaxID=1329796 RepID=UPI0005CBFBDD|nr:hypothetical protein [Risungbinella massiliensis]